MVEEEVLSIGRLRLMPLLVVVVAFEESVGFFSACSFAWSFFQLLYRSVVVFPGMTGTMGALLGWIVGISRSMESGY